DTAHSAGMMVVISLWSFDMLQSGQYHPNGEAADLANNKAVLTDDTKRQKYIDVYLTPLVNALEGHPAIYAWEIFNEPEGMRDTGGWTTGGRVSMAQIQRTVNWFADAIHNADPAAFVTNGAQTFNTCANVNGMQNYYSNSALTGAGGRSKGTLDFYEV